MSEKIYTIDPIVKTYNNFITDEECKHFIKISKDKMKRSLVSNNDKGYVSLGRTSSNTWISHDYDIITKNVGERIAKIVGLPLKNAEKYQIIHYDKTQEYRNHYDSWDHDYSEKTLRCMKYGGARLMTALCYLNNVENGGGTKMTKLNITIKPEKGKLLIFQNTLGLNNHNKHLLSEHAGLPVEEGEKYAFNLWFKECDSTKLYSEFNKDYYLINNNNQNNNNNQKLILNINKNIEQKNLNYMIYNDLKFISKDEIDILMNLCKFNEDKRRSSWVNLNDIETITNKIEKITNLNREYFENINIIEYKQNEFHNKHFIAFNLNTDIGKKFTNKFGQRIFTITLSLSNNMEICFPNINENYILNEGDLLLFNNINRDVIINNKNKLFRNMDLERTIKNNNNNIGYIANVYIREKNLKGDSFLNK